MKTGHVEVDHGKYHPECFVCLECKNSITGDYKQKEDGTFICRYCNLPSCGTCNKKFSGACRKQEDGTLVCNPCSGMPVEAGYFPEPPPAAPAAAPEPEEEDEEPKFAPHPGAKAFVEVEKPAFGPTTTKSGFVVPEGPAVEEVPPAAEVAPPVVEVAPPVVEVAPAVEVAPPAEVAPVKAAGPGEILSLEELRDASVWKPKGIEPDKREQHLEPLSFNKTFGMDKEAFAKLPKFKRDKMKKDAGLF